MGRPTKLTPEVQKRICQGVSLGMTFEQAAQYGKISGRTFFLWMARGQKTIELSDSGKKISKKEELFFQFFQSIKDAEAEALARWLAQIEQAAHGGQEVRVERRYSKEGVLLSETVIKQPPQWAAAAWKLERRYPETFGRQPLVTVKAEAKGKGARVDVQCMSDDEVLSKLDELRSKREATE